MITIINEHYIFYYVALQHNKKLINKTIVKLSIKSNHKMDLATMNQYENDNEGPIEIFKNVFLYNLSLYFISEVERLEKSKNDYSDKGLEKITENYFKNNSSYAGLKKNANVSNHQYTGTYERLHNPVNPGADR